MSSFHTLKNHRLEKKIYCQRLYVSFGITGIAFATLMGRLFFLQVINKDYYLNSALNNQVKISSVAPLRGLIYDRNGVLLAENIPGFSLEITPAQCKDIKDLIKRIGQIIHLSESEIQNFYRLKSYMNPRESIPIRLKLTEAERATFSLNKYHLKGVDVKARVLRNYPMGKVFSHALGYVAAINEKDLASIDTKNYQGTYHIGKVGLENFYEKRLHGKIGQTHCEVDAKGTLLRVLNIQSAQNGENLHLTIDSQLQKMAYKALKNFKGSVVAIDPNNGEVLCLVSTPSFDPNLFAQGIPLKKYQDLQKDLNRPLFNRAIRGLYPPASTIKPIAALKGLDKNIVSAQTKIYDPGWFQINQDGRFYRDWNRLGHGWTNLEKAIQQSCDTYFWNLAHKMGAQALEEVYTQFGFGNDTGLDITSEAKGFVPNRAWKKQVKSENWYIGETLNLGIGQGAFTVTPLQMAKMIAILANRGEYFRPHLKKITDFESLRQPKIIYSKSNWDKIHDAMIKVVHSSQGTANSIAQNIRYQMAAKTGTAQIFSIKQDQIYEHHKVQGHLRDHGWFIAYAPAQYPKIAIAVLIENDSKAAKQVSRVLLDGFLNPKKKSLQKKFNETQSDSLF